MSHGIRIKDLPSNERPRERLAELGADALKTSELIAILLRTGLRGVSAIQIGEQLLQKFGTLTALERASLNQLREIKGIGRDKAIALKSAFTLARRMRRNCTVKPRCWTHRALSPITCANKTGATKWSIFKPSC